MRPNWKTFFIAGLLVLALDSNQAHGSVVLATLNDPTVQTLMSLGDDGVTVGPLKFYDFNLLPLPSATAPSAASIQVQPITANGEGIRFVAAWTAAVGSSVTDVITYKVAPTDPSQNISTISIFSDGSAPLPASGTFVTTSLTARTTGGTVANRILTTFDDGLTVPIDTTSADNDTDFIGFAGENLLAITDSISAVSSSGPSVGVAIASTFENTFDPVAVPSPTNLMFIPCIVGFITLGRRRRRVC